MIGKVGATRIFLANFKTGSCRLSVPNKRFFNDDAMDEKNKAMSINHLNKNSLSNSKTPTNQARAKVLSHLDQQGKAKMVDTSMKTPTIRKASAKATVILGKEAFILIRDQHLAKGDALTVSELAGILGAKKTPDLIPLCHPINLTSVKCKVTLNPELMGVDIVCEAKSFGTTGVEMEALVGASVAALNVYDMCKAVTHAIEIREIKLLSKSGGKTDYNCEEK